MVIIWICCACHLLTLPIISKSLSLFVLQTQKNRSYYVQKESTLHLTLRLRGGVVESEELPYCSFCAEQSLERNTKVRDYSIMPDDYKVMFILLLGEIPKGTEKDVLFCAKCRKIGETVSDNAQ